MGNIKTETYCVQAGDTLTKIAKEQLGDSSRYMEIAKLNNIVNPNLININQKLIMPTTASAPIEEIDLSDHHKENTTTEKEAVEESTIINKNQSNKKAKNNLNEFSIEPRSRIDNSEGERNKRVQWLTNGHTGDEWPPEGELYALTTEIEIPLWNGTSIEKMQLRVNKKLANSIQNIFAELAEKKYPIEFAENEGYYEIYGYEYRPTGSGGRLSDHAYGGAIDINARHNPMTGPKDALKENDGSQYVVNEEVIDIFAKYGFYWGGDWNTSSDPMHFSFTGW